LYSASADGDGKPIQPAGVSISGVASSWSPDGGTLAFLSQDTERIQTLSLTDGKVRQLFDIPSGGEGSAAFSPDGHWMAYTSFETNSAGTGDVYVVPYPALHPKTRISTAGGDEVVWARDGRTLFFRTPTQMMAVDVVLQPTF